MKDEEKQINEIGNYLYSNQDKYDLSNPFEVAKCLVEKYFILPTKASFVLGSRGSGKNAYIRWIEEVIKSVVSDILSMFDDKNYITENDLKNAIAKRYGV